MFNRGRERGDASAPRSGAADPSPELTIAPPTGAGQHPPAPTPPEDVEPPLTGQDVEALFRRLDDEVTRVAQAEDGTAPLRRIATEASDQADSLRAAATAQKDAQKEAQKILGAAARERDRAAAQAADLLAEAREAATRLQAEAEARAEEAREELSAWAAEQRTAIDTVVTDLRESAEDEAGQVRADAERQAMVQARAAARKYVARAADIATREGEQHRAEAREVLERTSRSVVAARDTMQQFTDQLTSFLTSMGGHLDELEAVTVLAAARVDKARKAPPLSLGEESWDVDEAALSEALATTPVEEELEESGIESDTAAAKPVARGGTPAPSSRPLGSLFRGPEPQAPTEEG